MTERREKQPEPQHADGAPEWMVTFSDCMTLLLTFFVLLLSFSSFDDKAYKRLNSIGAQALSSIRANPRPNKESVIRERDLIQALVEPDKGSEQPTDSESKDNALMKEKDPVDLDDGRVILIPSSQVFWGKGKVISSEGRDKLSDVAAYLDNVSNRVVIVERGTAGQSDNTEGGLARAWAVLEHFVKVHRMDRGMFSISAVTTVSQEQSHATGPDEDRTLEIVVLDRSISH